MRLHLNRLLAFGLAVCVLLGAAACAKVEEAPLPEQEESSEPSRPEESSASVSEPEESSEEASEPEPEVQVQQPEPVPESRPEPEPPAPVQAPGPANAKIAAKPNWRAYGFTENYQHTVGSQEWLDSVTAVLQNLDASRLTDLVAAQEPNDYSADYALSDGEVEELLGMLRCLDPELMEEEELGNPATGGGWSVYVESPEHTMLLSYSGWFSVSYPNSSTLLVFTAGEDDSSFTAVNDYLWAKMAPEAVPEEPEGGEESESADPEET